MDEQKLHTRENRGTIHRMADPRLLFLFSRPPRRTFTRLGLGLGLGLGLARLLFLFSRPRRTFTRRAVSLATYYTPKQLLFLSSRPPRLHFTRLPCYLLLAAHHSPLATHH